MNPVNKGPKKENAATYSCVCRRGRFVQVGARANQYYRELNHFFVATNSLNHDGFTGDRQKIELDGRNELMAYPIKNE